MLVNQSKFRSCVRRTKAGDNLREISESCKHIDSCFILKGLHLWREGVSTSVSFISISWEKTTVCLHVFHTSDHRAFTRLRCVSLYRERRSRLSSAIDLELFEQGRPLTPEPRAILTFSPSPESVSSRAAREQYVESLFSPTRGTTQHPVTFLKPFSNPCWFYMIFIMWKESFCNQTAQEVKRGVLKKKKRSLHCIPVNVGVTLPEAFYCYSLRLSWLQMLVEKKKKDHSCVYQKSFHSRVNNFHWRRISKRKRNRTFLTTELFDIWDLKQHSLQIHEVNCAEIFSLIPN